ncbi:MAG: hypothetical protein ABWZ25_17060 [Chitinophagaceae bacterium]
MLQHKSPTRPGLISSVNTLALIIGIVLNAQTRISAQTIDTLLNYRPVAVKPSSDRDPVTPETPLVGKLSAVEKQKFRDKWLAYLITTKNNLQDDSLFLKRDYDLLWPGFHAQFSAEVDAAIIYCKTGVDQSGIIYCYLPPTSDIEAFLDTLNSVTIEKTSTAETSETYNVYKVNPFNLWLFQVFKKYTETGFPFQDMDISYIKDWRNIEYIFREGKNDFDSLTKMINGRWDMDLFMRVSLRQERYARLLADNKVLRYLTKAGNFYQQTLWFTGGRLTMNPLIITDKLRLYPARENNMFLPGDHYKILDSLEKIQFHKGLFTTRRLHNKVYVPYSVPGNSTPGFFVQYDATNGYKPHKPIPRFLFKQRKLITIVHNLPAENSVELIAAESEEIKNESRAAGFLSETFGAIGGVITGLAPLAGVAGVLVNTFKANAVLRTIPGEKNNSFKGFNSNALANSAKSNTKSKPEWQFTVRVKSVEVKVDGKTDLGKILEVAYLTGDTLKDKFIRGWIDSFFFNTHAYNNFDVTNPQFSADDMLSKFAEYLVEVADGVLTRVAELRNQLLPVVRIYDRSLPPSTIEEVTNSNHVLRSEVHESKLPKPTARFRFELYETSEKPADRREVVSSGFKMAKKIYFGISAGLDYTFFKEYVNTPHIRTGVPDIHPADHFQFTAVAHWYPWGINNLDDSLFPMSKNRISVFAGLGLTKPLDNYYTGMSYDIIPGLKLLAGMHFYRRTRYRIVNDQIIERASMLRLMGPSIGIHLDYKTVGTLLGFFK